MLVAAVFLLLLWGLNRSTCIRHQSLCTNRIWHKLLYASEGSMRKTTLAATLIVFAGLAGCAKVRYPNYYELGLPAPASTSANAVSIPGTVSVREFRAARYLTKGPIVYRPEPEQIAFYNYEYWAEDPRRAVTTAVIHELQHTGVFESAGWFDGRGNPDYLITGSLDRLEEVDSGTSVAAEVGLSARLQDLKTGAVIWSGSSSERAAVERRSAPGLVAEMSRELNAAATQLVSSMQKRVSATDLASR